MRPMVARTVWLGLLLMAGSSVAQQPGTQGNQPGGQPAYSPATQQNPPAGQPVAPPGYSTLPGQPQTPQQVPVLQANPNALQPNANVPQIFQPPALAPAEEAQLDQILRAWEASSAQVKNFACVFTRYGYGMAVVQKGTPENVPSEIDTGEIKFASPDKGMFLVNARPPRKPDRPGDAADPGRPPERWICDGTSIYEYDYVAKKLTNHKLPKELRGKAIANGPLPFLFGSTAAQLKQRYFLRIVTPPDVQARQVWLTGYPRYQQDAANFSQADLVLSLPAMQPVAMQLFPPGKRGTPTRQAYVFQNVKVNDLFWFVKPDPFLPERPNGWQTIIEEAPVVQVSREQSTQPGQRR